MKNIFLIPVFLCSFSAVAAGPLDRLSFLTGCWGTTNEKRELVTEDWLRSTNQAMLGLSRTLTSGNDLVQYEFIEIKWIKETNRIFYTPTLNGRRLNSFELQPNVDSRPLAVFADPKNSNLKKISYFLKDPRTLNVRLEGISNGTVFDFNFDMSRQDCRSRF